MKLPNYLADQWVAGSDPGTALVDPVTGDELARISSEGVDLQNALEFARTPGGPALRRLTYGQRAEMLAKIGEVLTANRDEYFRISLLNLGATQADASFDVDGALYTMKYYAKIGRALADGQMLKEGAALSLSKTGVFGGQHFLTPAKGVAVFINAFNFPAWGFCEKAAPALLSGVPIVVKPASPTAWLAHRMVADVVQAGILPPGAITLDGGSSRLRTTKVGNPRNAEVKVGPVVNKAQQAACLEGLRKLRTECSVVFGGDEHFQPVDADSQRSAFVQPTVLLGNNGLASKYVHDVEVFGPVMTLIAYDSPKDLIPMVRRGSGSLVASVFSNDPGFLQEIVLGIGDLHGRIVAVDSTVGSQHTGHGNVVPSCLHGGPGRAGGGEELAGLRALLLYHRRFVVQGPVNCLKELSAPCADSNLLYS